MRMAAVLAVWFLATAGALATDEVPAASDEETLRAASVGIDGPSLLDYFRRRAAGDVEPAKVEELVRQLGDDSFEVRERATARLVAFGSAAASPLERAVHDQDPEVARRAEHCLEVIRSGGGSSIPAAAARLVARRKPQGAAAALLAYLPSAENTLVAGEVRRSLAAVAVHEGRTDPALVAALSDKAAIRRAAAAEALIKGGVNGERSAVRPLLKDPDPGVRLKVALLLAGAGDREAIPILVELVGELPQGESWQAVDFLSRLAGEAAPAAAPGEDEASRQTCRDAWRAWWQKHRGQINLASAEQEAHLLGYTMVVLLDRNLVMELDREKKPRWKIEGVQKPLDAQLLPGGRILIAEQAANRVTERALDGKVVWEKQIEGPLMAQRLANGNTFMCNPNELLEVDRTGKAVFSQSLPAAGGEQFMRAEKLPNGDIACVLMARGFLRMDSKGKELSGFPLQVATSGGRINVLGNGHILVPHKDENRVIEYDAGGKSVWEATVDQPIAAVRLSSGNTLITSMTQNRAVELDRAGKEVWEYRSDTRVTRAWRR